MCGGWWIGDYNAAYQKTVDSRSAATAGSNGDNAPFLAALTGIEEPQRRFRIHFQLGLATALTTVLINSLSVTYLIGTSRWVKEVSEAYELNPRFFRHSTQLKRHTFPWSLAGVAAIITVVALGAASDPGTLRETTANWVLPQSLGAMIGSSLIVWALMVQAYNLHRNSQVIDQVVEEVRRERLARGLEVEEQGGG